MPQSNSTGKLNAALAKAQAKYTKLGKDRPAERETYHSNMFSFLMYLVW